VSGSNSGTSRLGPCLLPTKFYAPSDASSSPAASTPAEPRYNGAGAFAMTPLRRITRDPAVMSGKPCIRGMRVTVGTVVG
jgi:hypothetical protein